MPTSRSKNWPNSSRSPALPPNASLGSAPRQYLPPSHYAAAGGFDLHSSSGRRIEEDAKRTRYNNPTPGALDSDSSLDLTVREQQGNQRNNAPSGIPNLETQLLPSLRDTIDRMTCVPSRASVQYKTGVGTEKRGSSSRSRRNSPTANQTPTQATKSSHAQIYSPRYDDTMLPNNYSDQRTPTMSRLKAPVKSALKSSFRSPKSVPPSPVPYSTPVVASPSMAGSSLRSMKSLLSRKCSGTLKSPFNGSKAAPRKASMKDENTAKQDVDYTPRLSSKKPFQSSIPRPRNRHYNENPTGVEDSDLDQRYEDDLRKRRKLTVANAAISLSSSDSDVDSRTTLHEIRNIRPNDKSNVGLGLSFAQDIPIRSQRHAEARPNTLEKTLRFSLPNSESAGSCYSEEFDAYRPPSRDREIGPAEFSSRAEGRIPSYTNRSDYYHAAVEPPLDIRTRVHAERRPSPQATRRSHSPVYLPSVIVEEDAEDTESEREGYSIRRSKVQDKVKDSRRRSSSCEPRYAVETDSGDVSVPIKPHRPKSALQRDRSPSPRSSRVFPPNLRDLIKSRNSFSKLPPTADQDNIPPTPISSPRYSNSTRYDVQPSRAKAPSPTPPASRGYNSLRSRLSQYHPTTEAAAIVDGYRFAAARERMAFGIPPSESDEMLRVASDEMGFSLTESEASSLDQRMWQDEESEELSVDAESIFKAVDYNLRKKDTRWDAQRMYMNTPRLSVISPTVSVPSVYDENISTWSAQRRDRYPSDNGSRPSDSFAQNIPKTREGVIQEIFESEEELLRLFRICMEVFILPLRAQNSRSWISGVPRNVTKLLDWFNDIVNLHEQIYESLCLARDTMSPATDRVSESLRCFVLKVEVYQPYLVRLSDVSQEIVLLTKNPKDDLGQFINIQQRSPACEGWTFDRLLMLPVNRLAEYQDLFSRMLDLTPKTHQDYLSTFSLSRSTDMVIMVMTEVKIREDEYNLLKAFSLRVHGLSSCNELATRQRRLLHSGVLSLVLSGMVSSEDESNKSSAWQQERDDKRTKRASKLLDAISASSSTAFDWGDTVKSTATGGLLGGMASNPAKSTTSSWFSRLPLRKRSPQKSPISTVPSPVHQIERLYNSPSPLTTVSIHAFIFNDLVLLSQPSQTLGNEPHWILSKDLGAFRPLSIARIQAERKEGIIISLESMTLDLDQLNETADFRTMSFRNVHLVLPKTPGISTLEDLNASSDLPEQSWLQAFRKCCETTLRKLTFPGGDNSDDFFTSSDRTLDTHVAVSSLVASGLPIPRSPSGTYPDMRGTADGSFIGDEREERGWWSLRYQQVFREFQRQGSLLSDDDEPNNL